MIGYSNSLLPCDYTGTVLDSAVSLGGSSYKFLEIFSDKFNTNSDRRLKTNIQPMTNSLELINQLNPMSYNLISDNNKFQIGLIADEAMLVMPETVSGQPDALMPWCNDCRHQFCKCDNKIEKPSYQSIDYTKYIGLLLGGIKELNAIVVTQQEQSRLQQEQSRLQQEQINSLIKQ